MPPPAAMPAILAQAGGPALGPDWVVAIMALGVLVALAGHIGRSASSWPSAWA